MRKVLCQKIRLLLCLMAGCPEFKFWEKDNDQVVLDVSERAHFMAAIHTLEVLLYKLEERL